jgi:hypothetical protein
MKLELKLEEVNTVLAALAELPFKISADLIVKIKMQAEEQLKQEQEASTSPKE